MPKKQIIDNTMSAKDKQSLEDKITGIWSKIAPFWPLKNLIAVNPIAGFEDLPFEDALKQAKAYFQQKDIPEGMSNVNRESIKWLQAFFDEGQSTIRMPNRHLGFLRSTLELIKFDKKIHKNDSRKLKWIINLPHKPETVITQTLLDLGVPMHEQEIFLTLMLTTLPGWAAHIKYCTNWADKIILNPITQSEYLAFRLVIVFLLWPEAKDLIVWHQKALKAADVNEVYKQVCINENLYQRELLKQFKVIQHPNQTSRSKAQLVFCIDVRSEPFRRNLEAQDDYETFGFAGFFGVPVKIKNSVTGESHASCPVLLNPTQIVIENPNCLHQSYHRGHSRIQGIKKLYQSLKYSFTTPFSLVEFLGMGAGLWMGVKCFSPSLATKIKSTLKKRISPNYSLTPDIQTIPFAEQVDYAIGALKVMGLTKNFAPLVVFCGHGSTTQNNAYATALDCGACGGHHGGSNARILAAILNAKNVRQALVNQHILLPDDTLFVAAEHNTTTDEVTIYADDLSAEKAKEIDELKQALEKTRDENILYRAHGMGLYTKKNNMQKASTIRSQDWAEVRPEWGLAKNAAFIIAPRSFTKGINLEGRSFLHSYEWEKDLDTTTLATILTAPMVVAQWINAQYLFSTLDNVAFGGGSKVTSNITGKIGVMQGNASDLMHGLPLQSVYKSDEESYHIAQRLTVIVYAPKTHINPIIKQHASLQKLFGNEWLHLICYDPVEKEKFSLHKSLTWIKMQ